MEDQYNMADGLEWELVVYSKEPFTSMLFTERPKWILAIYPEQQRGSGADDGSVVAGRFSRRP